jgi:hypothetical protein
MIADLIPERELISHGEWIILEPIGPGALHAATDGTVGYSTLTFTSTRRIKTCVPGAPLPQPDLCRQTITIQTSN